MHWKAVFLWPAPLSNGCGTNSALSKTAAETERLAEGVPCDQSELLIPAFTGLGAPYWDPDARAAIFGMTRDTGKKQLAAAALRSVALQTRDLLQAMVEDGQTIETVKVDGGMTDNGWFMQALADITGYTVLRADTAEITARGAAFFSWFRGRII